MATFSGSTSAREDFRCSLCRRKGAFHCEHNTPYRDQFLDTYGQERQDQMPASDRRDIQRTGSLNTYNAANKNRMYDRNTNAQYRQDRNNDYGSMKNNKPKKKKKLCVIS